MARKDHLITIQEDSKLNKKFASRNDVIAFQAQQPTIAQQINGIGATSKTPDEVKDTKFPVLNPIDPIGKNLTDALSIDLALENSPFHCLELSDVGATVATLTVNLINLVKNKAEKFILDITKDPANTIDPTIVFSPTVENLPSGFPTADPRYLLEIVARETPTETRYEVVNRISGGGTIPDGTADFQHLEWDNTGLKWDALDATTLQNATGIIKWKNAAGTEEATLSVTGIDNFLWTDFTTGAPHTMGFSGLQLRDVGHVRSGNIPTPSTGFIQLGNTDSLNWRNAANTNNASFEFNAADKFEFTDLAAGGILATIGSTELDLKIGGLLLTMGNNKAIQFRNVADTEFAALTLSSSNNFTWVDPPTGSPHIMFFDGLLLQSIGELRSDNIPVPSTGFIKLGNTDSIDWRNAANTNSASFEFNAADKFEFTDLAAGGILATIDGTELDLKIGGLLLTMGNNKAIQFRNAADTEFSAITLSSSNNFTVIDAPTGAPHDFIFGGMNLLSITSIVSDNVPTSTGGFINMGNNESIKWRNAGNTADFGITGDASDNISIDTNFRSQTDGSSTLGDLTHHWDDVFSETFTLRGSGGNTTGSARTIYATAEDMIHNVPTGDAFQFRRNNVLQIQFTGSNIQGNPDGSSGISLSQVRSMNFQNVTPSDAVLLITIGTTPVSLEFRNATAGSYDFQLSGASKLKINPTNFTLAEGIDLIVGTTTGTKIGTSTTQKLGFFGATPVVQSPPYSVTNLTTDRSYDADATTLEEIADVLGTALADLSTLGIL